MIKFLVLEENIAYRVGVVDNFPDNLCEFLKENKIDKVITKEVYIKEYKNSF